MNGEEKRARKAKIVKDCFKLLDSYPGGKCPDCGEPIPPDKVDGEACKNCGHVFYEPKPND